MGAEASCRLRVGKKWSNGKALLETDELLFRGEPRLKIPFSSIRSVEATDGLLRVEHELGVAELEIGPAAERWASKIRSPRTRLDKLGVKAGDVVSVLHVDDGTFADELRALGAHMVVGKVAPDSRFVFLGVSTARDLPRIAKVNALMEPTAALWVIHPKGVDGVKDTDIFGAARAEQLVYSKVARFSDTRTAEKLTRAKSVSRPGANRQLPH